MYGAKRKNAFKGVVSIYVVLTTTVDNSSLVVHKYRKEAREIKETSSLFTPGAMLLFWKVALVLEAACVEANVQGKRAISTVQ